MSIRRPLVLRAPLAAAVILGSTAALADEPAPAQAAPPAAGRQAAPVHVSVDLLGGLAARLGHYDSIASRGGGLVGLNVLVGHKPWYSVGLGYEHAFYGREQLDTGESVFSQVNRTLDTLWFLGRAYPYMSDAVGIYVQLGLGPTWQGVNASTADTGVQTGMIGPAPTTMACSAHSGAGLNMRLNGGAEFALTNLISFTMGVGVEQLAISSKSIGGCVTGTGPQTSFTLRAGLTLTTGRGEAPPPPPPEPVKPAPPPDRDGDGIVDASDACPDVKGVPNADPKKHGCPPPSDRDGDSIFDEQDACPDEAGVPSDDPKKNGCPPPKDRDGDGIVDERDACPDIKGVPSDDAKQNGCPPDTDGDGIRDDQDACPKEKGPANAEDPAKNGCPLVQVTEKEIVINEQVQFEVDRSVIRPASDPLLNQVAAVIKDHPEILKLEVQGHTDNTGNKERNRILSQSRADAVKKALVKRGIADKRLEAKGYGQEKPIAPNDTDAGKAKNRRVQFQILQKGDAPAAKPGDKPAQAPAPAKKPDAPKPAAPKKQ